MRNLKLLGLLSLIWLSILLTSTVPSTALAQASCQELFSGATSTERSTVAVKALPLPNKLEEAIRAWSDTFDKVRTFPQFKKVLSQIDKKMAVLSVEDVTALQRIDLTLVAQAMSPADQLQLKALSTQAAQRTYETQEISPLDSWLSPLEIYFVPQRALQFVQEFQATSDPRVHLAEAFSGYYGLRSFNQTLATILKSLPEAIKESVLRDLKRQMSNIKLTDEIMTMQDGRLQKPSARVYRRNIEIISAQVTRTDFETLKKTLSKSTSQKEILSAVDKYYKKIGLSLAAGRGHYSFAKVLKSAEILQKSMDDVLNETDFYVDMYGSFTNGKAAFTTSDIDIRFSKSLLEQLTGKSSVKMKEEPFSLFFVDMVARDKKDLPKQFADFWRRYKKAEVQLGTEIFERAPTKPSELLTSLYPPHEDSNDAVDFRWYNPLVLRIYKDRIAVQLVELNDSPAITEITIPQK